MPETQLRLFPCARPLQQRLGQSFFRSLPKAPGVYLMFDVTGRILYVGQSKNLRQRVGSYRHVHPDRRGRKLVRLVHAVDRIEWEECASEQAAKLRENALLREHRPRFNSLNTYPKAHCFIGVQWSENRVEFCFTREVPETNGTYHGAYKSGCLRGYVSLLRLLWTVFHQAGSAADYPRALLAERVPRQFAFESIEGMTEPGEVHEMLAAFFAGQSNGLAAWLRERMPAAEKLSLFQQKFVAANLEEVEMFFRLGPQRNARLREKHQLPEPLIGQETLDDLLVMT